MHIPYLFKYFASGLNLILFTYYFSSAQTRLWSKTLHSIIKQFIQGVLAWKVFPGQGVKMIHAAVWTLCTAWYGASFDAAGKSLFLFCTSDVVPRQEGQHGVQPDQKVDGEKEDRLKDRICLWAHRVLRKRTHREIGVRLFLVLLWCLKTFQTDEIIEN